MLHRNLPRITVLFALIMVVIGSGDLLAASIKDRMVARLPTINALKDQGILGENNGGYLEYRTAKQPEKEVIDAENTDRRAVYQAIAKKQGVSPALVGKRRALQLAEKGAAGHWYQKPDGSWYKK